MRGRSEGVKKVGSADAEEKETVAGRRKEKGKGREGRKRRDGDGWDGSFGKSAGRLTDGESVWPPWEEAEWNSVGDCCRVHVARDDINPL